MGYYLNSGDAFELYERETNKPYFIDKTEMLKELFPLVEQKGSNISVTRPRRFGKSVMAAMIGSFFGKGTDSSEVFSKLAISKNPKYAKHLNQHNVIYIDFSKGPDDCRSYDQYITYIRNRLLFDLREAYPDAFVLEDDSPGEVLSNVFRKYNREKFILVFDEWDYIFHRDYFTKADRGRFTAFLGSLTKGRTYIEMTYMTGILPIKKYSGSSTMNHFSEYNMANSPIFGKYFGFTNPEVDELYQRYRNNVPEPEVSREDLKVWYDGYLMESGNSLYNPNSVVFALTWNQAGNYWSRAGEYDELKDYVLDDTDGVREAVIMLAAGEPVQVDMEEYATTAAKLTTRDEILSVMTIYGYLNYHDGYVRIPNKELQIEFDKIIKKGYLYRTIYINEANQAAEIEQICFPPNEACAWDKMLERVQAAPELFLVAVDVETEKIVGCLNGLATDENTFRDEFFTNAGLFQPDGKNIMLLGLGVLPEYRHQGIARELVKRYADRERAKGRESLILTCLRSKVAMYEKMGFEDEGISGSSWGGEEWHEMRMKLKNCD